jgi:hypothetical protein
VPRRTGCASGPFVEGRGRHKSLDTAAELIGHPGPASRLVSSPDETDHLGQLQEVGEPEPRPAPGDVPVAVGGAEVGPFGRDAEDRAVRALEDDPALLTGVPSVQQGEGLAAQRVEGMGDSNRGFLWTVRSPMG